MNKRAILIAGPTASGKTALALQLAKEIRWRMIDHQPLRTRNGVSSIRDLR